MAVQSDNTVLVEHLFKADVKRVFAAIKAGRLFFNCGAWPEGTTCDFRVGGKFHFNWGHHGSTEGRFTSIVEDKQVAFTWSYEPESKNAKETLVTIDLVAQGDGCLAKLKHVGLPDREIAESHEGGWGDGLTGVSNELSKHCVRIEREFQAPVELLYKACSGMAFFELLGATAQNAQIDFRVGGRYDCQLPDGNKIGGEFLEIAPSKKIAFTWEGAPCGEKSERTTRVAMEFGPWGEGGKNSYLELVHEGFDGDEQTFSHHEGWNSILYRVYKRVAQ